MASKTTTTTTTPLHKALDLLQSHTAQIDRCIVLLRSASDHLSSLEASIASRSASLEASAVSFESSNSDALRALSSLPVADASAAAALVEQRKAAALQEIEAGRPATGVAPSSKAMAVEELYRRCKWMDSGGLWRFIAVNRKYLGPFRMELSKAVESSVDPSRLVLDAVEDFLRWEWENPLERFWPFWACGMLVKVLLEREGGKEGKVAGTIREKAVEVLEKWKKSVEETMRDEERKINGSEAQLFMQFLVVFGLGSRVEEELLKVLSVESASWREVPRLAALLGLHGRMHEIIDELLANEKELEAVYFAHASGTTGKYYPVTILKAYFEKSTKKIQDILVNGKYSRDAKEESESLEFTVLIGVLRCVQVLQLQEEFPIESIRMRAAKLEKAMGGKKRKAVISGKPRYKWMYTDGGTTAKIAKIPDKPSSHLQDQNASARRRTLPRRQSYKLPSMGGHSSANSASYIGSVTTNSTSLSQRHHLLESAGAVGRSYPGSLLGRPHAATTFNTFGFACSLAPTSEAPSSLQGSFPWRPSR